MGMTVSSTVGIEQLKAEVLTANLELVTKNLVISTWGNVSGFDPETGFMVIKASGIPYEELTKEHMVVVNLEGQVVEGDYMPSTDTDTHIELYKKFGSKGIRGIVHTHSQFAAMWAQMGKNIPCYGTTHCDYFYGDIPCTRPMRPEEITEEYEKNTGKVILETFENRSIDFHEVQAVLVRSHAPFVWGKTPAYAVLHSQVLEYIAKMAYCNYTATNGECDRVQQEIMDKHYNRKFGPSAYYGQRKQG